MIQDLNAPDEIVDLLSKPAGHSLLEDIGLWSKNYRLKERLEKPDLSVEQEFQYLLKTYPEFRNLTDYRVSKAGVRFTAHPELRRLDTLGLWANEIGPRLFIQHGFSTILLSKRVGSDCHINQNVTIGFSKGRNPVIGNRVRIAAGAVVVGDIRVGDNCFITANAVVNFDVPPNSTVYAARSTIKLNKS